MYNGFCQQYKVMLYNIADLHKETLELRKKEVARGIGARTYIRM